jgi:predicted metal-binding membrane protein
MFTSKTAYFGRQRVSAITISQRIKATSMTNMLSIAIPSSNGLLTIFIAELNDIAHRLHHKLARVIAGLLLWMVLTCGTVLSLSSPLFSMGKEKGFASNRRSTPVQHMMDTTMLYGYMKVRWHINSVVNYRPFSSKRTDRDTERQQRHPFVI